MSAAWIQGIATILAVVLTAVLSTYVRGQQLVKISEKRLDAYAPLWELTKSLRRNGPAQSDDDFRKLADAMTAWYYEPGHGMLATERVVALFLKLRDNLTCAPEEFYPASWRPLWGPLREGETLQQRRQHLLAQQFSILRTQMKMDCAIYYGRHVSPNRVIAPYEVDFITELKVRRGRAWRMQIWRAVDMSQAEYLGVLGLASQS